MPNDSLDIHVIETVEELDIFKSSWKELYGVNRNAHPYLCYDYFRAVLKYFGKLYAIKVAVLKQKLVTIAIVPFQLKQKKIGSLKICYIQISPDKWPPPYAGILSERSNHIDVVQHVFNLLADRDQSIAFCLLKNVPVGSHLFIPSETLSGPIGKFSFVKWKAGNSVVIKLPSSWESFLMALSRSNRKAIRKKSKEMESLHQVNMVRSWNGLSSEPFMSQNLIKDALKISRKSWQGSAFEGKAISDSDIEQFFEEVSTSLYETGMLDLSVLYADRIPVSYIWSVARGKLVYALKHGFDQSYSKLSPGAVLYSKLISDTIKSGSETIDLGEDIHTYKKRWSHLKIAVYDQCLFPKGFKGAILAKIFAVKKYSRKHNKKIKHCVKVVTST